MIYTNKFNLPAPFVSMCQQEYETAPNEFRVTQLLKSTRECILERRHKNETAQDVANMVWLLFGTAAHSVLEGHEETAEQFKEIRIKVEFGNYIVSGKPDLYDAAIGKVIDYKTASVWKIIYKNFADWRRQLLTYAVLLERLGFPCRQGEIVAMLKDHSKREAKIRPEYPQLPVHVEPFMFTAQDMREGTQWIIDRLMALAVAEDLPDDELPMCTLEERYNEGDKYAVMKKGRKRAMRVFDDKASAEQWLVDNGGDDIETRLGEDKKCLDYCSSAPFCNYWRARYLA